MKKDKTIKTIIEVYGEPFHSEIGIKTLDTPSHLFQWLYAAKLLSARIDSTIAVDAAKGLINAGYTTPQQVRKSTWEERIKVLNEKNYTRYEEKSATFLGHLSEKLLDKHSGDIRKIRKKADGSPKKLMKKIRKFKGIGRMGAAIFLREVQKEWNEFYPFIDRKSRVAARKLKLPTSAEELSKGLSQDDYVRLLAGLVRIYLSDDYDLKKAKNNTATINNKNNSKPKRKRAPNLKNKTREELYEMARIENISGRSTMNKEELIKALKK
jgi:endonuclease III